MRRQTVVLMAMLLVILAGCAAKPAQDKGTAPHWKVIKTGSITRAASQLPSDGAHVFQTEQDLRTWLERYGLDLLTDGADFSTQTVAVIIRRYGAFETVVRSVEVTESDPPTAVVVLGQDRSKSLPQPALPAGLEVRLFVAIQLPKVADVTVREAQ